MVALGTTGSKNYWELQYMAIQFKDNVVKDMDELFLPKWKYYVRVYGAFFFNCMVTF